MSIKDEDLVIDEVDNTEEDSIEISDESIETEPESEPATIQDEVDGDDEEEEDRVVTIGDEAPESEGEADESGAETKETPGWVKKVRKVNRKLESENKKLKRQLEANAKAVETEKPIELGEKPTLKGCGYDDAKFAEEIIAYDNRKRKVEAQAAEKAKMVEEQNAQWQKRQEKYSDLKQEHSFKDFSEAEELVVETFSQTQQSIIIQGAEDSALLVYALGKNPKKLEELSKITNPVDFAFSLAKVESQLNVKSKKAPKPEKRLNTGKAGGQSGNSDSTLDRLREEAARTGDYTKVTAYKRKLRKG
jgi:hypothetical protein